MEYLEIDLRGGRAFRCFNRMYLPAAARRCGTWSALVPRSTNEFDSIRKSLSSNNTYRKITESVTATRSHQPHEWPLWYLELRWATDTGPALATLIPHMLATKTEHCLSTISVHTKMVSTDQYLHNGHQS